jgi:osmotically-inducible protein OsmY
MLIRIGLIVALLASWSCSRTIDPAIVDARVTAAVKTALLNDPAIDGTLVTVRTEGGVVELGGSQPTAEAAARVETIVRGVQGVRQVHSSISVQSRN